MILGFKATNHPQQVTKRGRMVKTDDRAIHPDDFAIWNERFRFTIDAAASTENARLPRFWTAEQDALVQSWAGERIWCNPPYSDIRPWVEKAWQERNTELIVMLLPANRTEQGWWQDTVEPFRDRSDRLLRIEFLRGRLRFIQSGRKDIGPNERPPFGCCLLIWEA